MESAIIPMSFNLDKVLEKLNNVNNEKKIRRKDMANIFDDIVKGEDGMHTRPLKYSLSLINVVSYLR